MPDSDAVRLPTHRQHAPEVSAFPFANTHWLKAIGVKQCTHAPGPNGAGRWSMAIDHPGSKKGARVDAGAAELFP